MTETIAIFNELIWRRRELIDQVLNECLSSGIGEIERAWERMIVARETGDEKYVNYALMSLEIRYAREDVIKIASYLAKEIERLKGKKELYAELERKVRREFYDLLVKCVSEKLPF